MSIAVRPLPLGYIGLLIIWWPIFIAIKPSLSRWKMWPTMERANAMVADFAAKDERITYLDIATPMLGDDGKPRPELFVKDGLHLSRPGYQLWTSVVMPWASSVVDEATSPCP